MKTLFLFLALLFPALAHASCPTTPADCASPTYNVVTAVSVTAPSLSASGLTHYGTVIVDATGKFAVVSGLGTAGWVLTSNGAGVAPTYQAPAAGVSVTAADALVVITPSPGTGTFTVGVNHDTAATNDCARWTSATKLGTTGAPCASAIAGQSVLTFSGTPVATPYGTVCYPATGFTLANNTTYVFRANVQRPPATDTGVALSLDANNAINLVWQTDNNFKLGYTVAGVTTQVGASAQAPAIANGTYTFVLHISTDNTNGLTVWGELLGLATLPPAVRPTSAVTTGTWTPCVIAGGSSAQLRGTGIQYTSPF